MPKAAKAPKPAKPARAPKPEKAPKQAKVPKAAKAAKSAKVPAPASVTSGAQVLAFPEPAHKRRRRHVWLGVAGVAVVLAIVMVVALYSPVLAVKTITFKGNKLVAEKTLQAALEPLLSKPLPQVTQGDVSELLAKVPQIKSSRLVAQPPSTLDIQVVERIPVALLKNGKDYLLVDQDGVQLGSTRNPSTVPLPQIDGGRAAIGRSTFSAMTAVLATLPQSVLGKLANATAKSPDAVQLQLTDGKTVIWGNASDMELKAQVLDALINAPVPTPVDGTPPPPPVRVYDVSAPRHPVTR
ncbi:hypothetical protein AL755_08270 [Arthrobacter sp. ERGS1:01]|nr:hypothetical protein AL755_08270 [Arthrobacter sp. ERGS1:01]